MKAVLSRLTTLYNGTCLTALFATNRLTDQVSNAIFVPASLITDNNPGLQPETNNRHEIHSNRWATQQVALQSDYLNNKRDALNDTAVIGFNNISNSSLTSQRNLAF